MSARGTFLAVLFALASSTAVLADEPVTIGAIVADPEPHHMHMVALQGTVRQVRLLDPYRQPSGTVCYGAYLFTLQDDTGSLDVAVLGVCGLAVASPPEVSDGDKVLVTAQIQAPGHLGTFYGLDGRPHSAVNPQGLHAIAKDILPRGQ